MGYEGGTDIYKVPAIHIDSSATPAEAPFRITPSAAPTGTMAAGDIYVDSSTFAIKVHTGAATIDGGGSTRVIKNAATTLTAADSGALCLWSTAAGYLYTLPAAAAGLWFDFLVTTTITSVGAKVICASGDFIVGSFLQSPDGTDLVAAHAANGTTHLSWNGNGTTTGGYAGDSFRLTAISASQWAIQGFGLATGSEATPFGTS